MRPVSSADLDILGVLADLGRPVPLAGRVPASTIARLKAAGLIAPTDPADPEAAASYEITDAGRVVLDPPAPAWTGPRAADVADGVPHAREDGSIVVPRGGLDGAQTRLAYVVRNADGGFPPGAQAVRLPADELVRPLDPRTARDIAGPLRILKGVLDKAHRDPRLPPVGSEIRHRFRDQREAVARIVEDGVEFEGTIYPSVSSAARAAGGVEVDGFLFRGLKVRKSDAARSTVLVDFETPERLAEVRKAAAALGRDLDDLMVEALALYLRTHRPAQAGGGEG